MSTPGHPIEQLTDLLDERLSAVDSDEVRRHLAACADCRRELEWLTAGRTAAQSARRPGEAPSDLGELVMSRLDAVDRAAATSEGARTARRVIWAGVAAAAALLLYFAGPWRPPVPDPIDQARLDFEAVRGGSVELERRTTDAVDLERYFNEPARGPRIRVIDLGMMGWTLEGGVHRVLGGRPSALYVYRSLAGTRLVCQMYPGQLADLPTGDDTRRENGFEFRVYTRGGITLVFWQEGELVCVLAADLPAAEVVALAVAKAMAPA